MTKKNQPGRPARPIYHFPPEGGAPIRYPSCSAAARAVGASTALVLLAARRGSVTAFGLFSFTPEPPVIAPKIGRKRPVMHLGKVYESTAALARHLEVSQTTVYNYLRMGNELEGGVVTTV